jgi:hypothetical protein
VSRRKEAMKKIKELDVVELTKELPQIPKGTQGTVVSVYPSGDKVEVEFFDQEGNTMNVENVSVEFLRKVRKMKKAHKPSIKAKIDQLIESLAQDPQVRVKNPDEVKKYLRKFSDVVDIVPKVMDVAKKHFPEAQLVFTLYKDPEINDRHLVVYIRMKKYDELFMEKVRESRGEYREDLTSFCKKSPPSIRWR